MKISEAYNEIMGTVAKTPIQKICQTLTINTYKEGMDLLIAALGRPEENPTAWQKIKLPINNWGSENIEIGHEVRTQHMSGDSMPDELDTWWSPIQSALCK